MDLNLSKIGVKLALGSNIGNAISPPPPPSDEVHRLLNTRTRGLYFKGPVMGINQKLNYIAIDQITMMREGL